MDSNFRKICVTCYNTLPAGTGYVLSCGDFLCVTCAQRNEFGCSACQKENVLRLNLNGSADIPEDVQTKLENVSNVMEKLHGAVDFQIKNYKRIIRKLLHDRNHLEAIVDELTEENRQLSNIINRMNNNAEIMLAPATPRSDNNSFFDATTNDIQSPMPSIIYDSNPPTQNTVTRTSPMESNMSSHTTSSRTANTSLQCSPLQPISNTRLLPHLMSNNSSRQNTPMETSRINVRPHTTGSDTSISNKFRRVGESPPPLSALSTIMANLKAQTSTSSSFSSSSSPQLTRDSGTTTHGHTNYLVNNTSAGRQQQQQHQQIKSVPNSPYVTSTPRHSHSPTTEHTSSTSRLNTASNVQSSNDYNASSSSSSSSFSSASAQRGNPQNESSGSNNSNNNTRLRSPYSTMPMSSSSKSVSVTQKEFQQHLDSSLPLATYATQTKSTTTSYRIRSPLTNLADNNATTNSAFNTQQQYPMNHHTLDPNISARGQTTDRRNNNRDSHMYDRASSTSPITKPTWTEE